MYFQPGIVQVRQNNLVWINHLWGKQFKVSFYITIKAPVGANDKINILNIQSETGSTESNSESNLLGIYLWRDMEEKPKILVQYKNDVRYRIVNHKLN